MKYNPDKHHRRSIRLKGYDYSSPGAYFITICTHQRECLFGEVIDGEMQLNRLGQMVNACWQRLPLHFPTLTLDAFVVMPNHIHGILISGQDPEYPCTGAALGQNFEHPCTGAALGQNFEHPTHHPTPNATPCPNRSPSEPGVAFGTRPSHCIQDGRPSAAPLPPSRLGAGNDASRSPRLGAGTVGAIVLNFKSVTTRSCNRIQRSPSCSIWQRNYYEHIIRNEASWCRIRQYIDNNPLVWHQDQLHPGNPSKW